MPDKIVNHFVLADGSTAKYNAGSLVNLDETVSLAGYAPDAKAVGDRLTDVENLAERLNEGGLELKDEVIGENVNDWMDTHPEASTTVLDDSLTTAKYKDGSVTTPKLANNAVTEDKLAPASVVEGKVNVNFLAKIQNAYITPKQFGAVGDGVADDTNAIQECFDRSGESGIDIVFPAGIYKITRTVSIKWDKNGNVRKKTQKIVGSGINAFDSIYDSCIIKAYNISDFGYGVEISGNSNVHAPSIEISNISFCLDEETCSETAFSMLFGDSWVSSFERVKFYGKNGLLLRCGSFDNGSYADVCLSFRNCVFNATSNTGFGLLPEKWINGYGQPFDSVLFESCYINGVIGLDVNECSVINCLSTFRMSKSLYTRQDISLLAGYNIDYRTAFLVGTAKNIRFSQCYNEDFASFVTILPVTGIIWNVTVDDCYCNSPSNQFLDGVRYSASNCVKVIPNTTQTTWRVRNLRVNNLLCRTFIDSTEGTFPFLDGYEIVTNNKVDRCIITNSYDLVNGKVKCDTNNGFVINDIIDRTPTCLNVIGFSYTNGWHLSNGNTTEQYMFTFGDMYLSKIILRNVIDDFITFQIRDENNVLIQEVGKTFFTKMANNVYSFEFGSNTFPMTKLPKKCYLTIYAGKTGTDLPSADLYVYM